MSLASSTTKDLALRLVSAEASSGPSSGQPFDLAIRVCERLRLPFTKLAGNAGFSSFMSRSLTLAKVDAPTLRFLEVQENGALARNGLQVDGHGLGKDSGADIVLVGQLLHLLVTFIGERLTLTLILETWPGASNASASINGGDKV